MKVEPTPGGSQGLFLRQIADVKAVQTDIPTSFGEGADFTASKHPVGRTIPRELFVRGIS